MRPLSKTISLIFLAIFVSASLFFAPQSHAAPGDPPPPEIFDLPVQPKSEADYLNEFCQKRSGDLMNLETWYSGKCTPTTDTLSGDGVGFSDIVLLQGLEYLRGPQTYDFLTSIVIKLNIIKGIKDKIQTGQISPSQVDLASVNDGGIVSALAGITTKIMTTRPASSLDYLAYVSTNLKNHHVINQAYAAGPGYGFTALSPILPLWRAFRNIAYLLFALGFVLYGVMIMFRVKIDAKTAASIQLAIPKLIVTLIVITFSYAIVGFLIDICTVISAMVINVLKAGGILTDINNFLPPVAGGQSFFGAVGSALLNGFLAIIVSPFIFFNLILGGFAGIVVAGVAVLANPLLGFYGMIVSIIILIAIVISYAKLIFKLFQAYFSVIISLIFSPIILLGNLMPGSTAISTWLMTLVGNLAVFPVASFFLVLSYALMCQPILTLLPNLLGHWTIPGVLAGAAGLNVSNFTEAILSDLLGVQSLAGNGNIWTPPMTIPGGGSSLSLTLGGTGVGVPVSTLFGSNGSLMLATIGFGLLLMSSKYCEMVEKALKTPPFPYGAAIGESLKGGLKGATEIANRRPGPSIAKDVTAALGKVTEYMK